MKNLKIFYLIMVILMISQSCHDTDFGSTSLLPTLNILNNLNIDNGSVEVPDSYPITFRIKGNASSSNLESLTFLESNGQAESSRISIEGIQLTDYQFLLETDDVDSFAFDIVWISHSTLSIEEYEIILTDELKNESSVSFTVSTLPQFDQSISIDIIDTNNGCLVVDASEITPDSWFCVNLEAKRSQSEKLSSLEIFENGNLLTDLSRLGTGQSNTVIQNNPINLSNDMQNGFTETIWVKAPSYSGVTVLEFVIKGEYSNTSSIEIVISTKTITTITILNGILLNSAGPQNTGGLDLETGTGTGSFDFTTDIRDLGIDITKPLHSNWIKKITHSNSSTIRWASSVSEIPYSFSQAESKENIEAAFDAGVPIEVTPILNISDEFLVYNGLNIFYVKISDIHISETDNSDYYLLDIKY